jgi:hypothetical protein
MGAATLLAVVISHSKSLFQYPISPDWLEGLSYRDQPGMTRLLDSGSLHPDADGVFSLIYFLSQISGLSRQ